MSNDTVNNNIIPNTILSIYSGSLITLGSVGNVLIVLVMYYDKGLKVTTRILFSLLAFGDFLVLWTLVIRYFVYMIFGFDFRSRDGNDLWCKVHIFIAYASSNFAMGSLCILCVDRCIAINLAIKNTISRYLHSSGRYILLAYILLICVIFGKHLYIGWKFGITPNGDCDEIIIENVHYWLDFITTGILPYLILIPANAMVYVALERHSRQMKRIGIHASTMLTKSNRPIVKMLITISLLHFVLTFPGFMFSQVLNPRNELGLTREIYFEISMGLLTVSFTNSAIPFYVYLMTTARFRTTFRSAMRALCMKPCEGGSGLGTLRSNNYNSHHTHNTTHPL